MLAGIAAIVAHVAFWVLLAYGWFWEEVGGVGVVIFLVLWTIGYFGLPCIPNGADLLFSYVAVLDVALVFIIFKGDIDLT
jgi:hypothetical protein